MIRGGALKLSKISSNLVEIPRSTIAELLVAPEDLAKIDGHGLGTWFDSIERIRQIDDYHDLGGMQVFERPKTAPDTSYEQALASEIIAAFTQATSSGEAVRTGWFMPTQQIVNGRVTYSNEVQIENNLYDRREHLTKLGDAFVDAAYWTSTGVMALNFMEGKSAATAYCVDFSLARDVFLRSGYKNVEGDCSFNTRPVALEIQPG